MTHINMDPKVLAEVIADTANVELKDKFIRGQHEHGGDFAVKPTVRNIREEILDLINYSHTLIQHRAWLMHAVDALLTDLPELNPAIIETRLKHIRQLVHDL